MKKGNATTTPASTTAPSKGTVNGLTRDQYIADRSQYYEHTSIELMTKNLQEANKKLGLPADDGVAGSVQDLISTYLGKMFDLAESFRPETPAEKSTKAKQASTKKEDATMKKSTATQTTAPAPVAEAPAPVAEAPKAKPGPKPKTAAAPAPAPVAAAPVAQDGEFKFSILKRVQTVNAAKAKTAEAKARVALYAANLTLGQCMMKHKMTKDQIVEDVANGVITV